MVRAPAIALVVAAAVLSGCPAAEGVADGGDATTGLDARIDAPAIDASADVPKVSAEIERHVTLRAASDSRKRRPSKTGT